METGQAAPTFELQNQNGELVRLSEYEGERVVLYFYPRAGTRGCTIQAESFRDEFEGFRDHDAVVLGVSTDPVDELAAFHEEYDLPFDLLSDPDGAVARAYDSFGVVEAEGETHEIAHRNTVVIGPEGQVERRYEGVDPADHPVDLLSDLRAE